MAKMKENKLTVTPCSVCENRVCSDKFLACKFKRDEFWNDVQGYEESKDKKLPLKVCSVFKRGDPDVEN